MSRTYKAEQHGWISNLLGRCCAPIVTSRPAKAALNRLGPHARYPSTVPFPLAEFPSVRCTSVVCSDDQLVGPDWQRRVALDRLGAADIIELPGSHSPFLSRPSALADVLLRIADGNQRGLSSRPNGQGDRQKSHRLAWSVQVKASTPAGFLPAVPRAIEVSSIDLRMLVEFRHVFRAWDGKVALRVQGAKQEKVQGEQKMPSELLG